MTTRDPKTIGAKRIGTAARQSVAASQESWVKTDYLLPGKSIPLVVQPAVDGINFLSWSAANKEYIDNLLLQHRALLFRNFNVENVNDFEQFVIATSDGGLLEYRDRSTPRDELGDKTYSSTIHPADQYIHLHNEGTYWITWALKIFFSCLKVPSERGETPIADVRKVYERIDPEIRDRFAAKKMMLVRNYNEGFGLPWQEVFQATDRAEVEEYCRQNLIDFEWKSGDRLRTRQVRPAIRKHPRTGDAVWFNHAAFFHVTSLEPAARDALMSEFGEEGLPYNTYYGDGEPIEPSVAEHLRDAYLQEKIVFPWQKGDILMLDNMSVAHGREPYVGDRLVVVGMTEPYTGNEG